ncbi:MAG: chemotaxis protein CheD [Gammaproteobacteria bacterium]
MKDTPEFVLEIFLQPGELHFGEGDTRIRTLLGSCVAMVLWHPRRKLGGMCHYLLPTRQEHKLAGALDGRYADEALWLFMHELERTRTHPADYQVKLFGGGHMLGKGEGDDASVPRRNVVAARELMRKHGFRVTAQDLGGRGHRNVIFDLWNGDVWVRRNLLGKAALSAEASAA